MAINLSDLSENAGRTKMEADRNMASIIDWERRVLPIQPFPHEGRAELKVGDRVLPLDRREGVIQSIGVNAISLMPFAGNGVNVKMDEVKHAPWQEEERKAYFDWRIKESRRVHEETQRFNAEKARNAEKLRK